MSFNFGPTLLSWMEMFAPHAYERIIKADIKSIELHSGHGNAIAQVYNHMIMPLANELDKQTQVQWGIRDFEYRFGRKPEGMWLAETAVDDDTLRVLAEHGIKFTILSPFQAKSIRKQGEPNWHDVSWGNIDPARSYRYYIKSAPDKYIDLFFYDGAISKSVAFDELLTDGNKFVRRLKDGVSYERNYPQLVNIATDGESYGHHTKFGDMALAYALSSKAKEAGFTITNYAEYLEKYASDWEVDIKDVSSWSCFHGVGRWCEDCGCSTGGHPGWNQKWRRPLRDAMDYLRDEIIPLCQKFGKKYFKDSTQARMNYIDVILDRSELSVKNFQAKYFIDGLDDISKKIVEIVKEKPERFEYIYDLNETIVEKINKVAMKIYGAKGVIYPEEVTKKIEKIEEMGYGNLPVCIAKTQYSFSDNAKNLECDEPFEINIRDVELKAGAGFIVVLAGKIMTMPGLPKIPAAETINIDENGEIVGIF